MKTVILLHGLHMHSWSLFYLIKKFNSQPDTKVVSFDYRSTLYSDKVLDRLEALVNKNLSDEIYFVGHSMGGLVAKNYLCKKNPSFNATLITLGTPHYGSALGTKLINSPFKIFMGKSGHSGILKKSWADWDKRHNLVCIAGVGRYGVAKILLHKDKRDSDGTVFLDEAIDEANSNKNYVVHDVIHSQMIASEKVWNILQAEIYSKG